MKDKYATKNELLAHERAGRDWRVQLRTQVPQRKVCVIATHGGGIEPGTSELADEIAGGRFGAVLLLRSQARRQPRSARD